MTLSAKQIDAIVNSDARLNILCGAVRSGKTYASLEKLIYLLRDGPRGDAMLVGVSRESIQRNIIHQLCEMLGITAPGAKSNEMQIFGRRTHLVGANDESAVRRIQGSTLAIACVDEAAVIPQSFFRMLLSRLSKPGAQLIATCNPEGPAHWLKTDFIDKADELGLKHWQFGLDDNPSLTDDYKDALKREYTGHWYARFILGEWAVAQGLVYDSLTPDQIVEEEFPTPNYYIVGVDYGITNPTAAVLIAVSPKRWPQLVVEREFYYDASKQARAKTDAELADALQEWLYPTPIRAIYIDPSAASFRLELRNRQLPIFDAMNDVIPGIRIVSKFISQKNLLIKRGCVNLIKELHSYAWDSKAADRGIDQVVKKNDHLNDSLRYALATNFKYGTLDVADDNITVEEIKRQIYGAENWQSQIFNAGGGYI